MLGRSLTTSAVLLSYFLFVAHRACALTPTPLVELTGKATGDGFGLSVAVVDANGDGWNDILVGAPYGEVGTLNGTLYVFFGGAEMDSTPDLVVHSPSPREGDYFAGHVSGLRDFNGDGYPDILVGPQYGGDSFIYYGGPLIDAVPDLIFPGFQGFWTNASVTGPGDVNGDGFSDVVIGSTFNPGFYAVEGQGYARLFYGGPGAIPEPYRFFPGAGRRYGATAAPVGDLNGDSVSDFAVSDTGLNGGTVYVYLGKLFDTQPPWLLNGPPELGYRVGSAGDWNADGFGDLIASSRGKGYVYWGGRDSLRLGSVLNGPNSNFGYSFAASRDATGDGVPDLFVASPGSVGKVYSYNGGTQPDASPDDSIDVGPTDSWSNGLSLCTADLTGDSFDEVIVGVRNDFSQTLKGKVYLFEVAAPLASRASLRDAHRTIPLARTPAQVCIRIEAIEGSYDNSSVDLSTIRLVSPETGSVGEIEPDPARTTITEDGEGILTWFARSDLARLFSSVRGRQNVVATVQGRLVTRRKFEGRIEMTILGPQSASSASFRETATELGHHFALQQNRPNPFNPWTSIEFEIPVSGRVTLRIFDVSGRLVRTLLDENCTAGSHRYGWNGRDESGMQVSSGVYYYEMRAGAFVERRRMVSLR